MRASEFKEYLKNKKAKEHLNKELPRTIKILEERIEHLKDKLKIASGWSNKELLRKTIIVNQKLLDDANKEFLRRVL